MGLLLAPLGVLYQDVSRGLTMLTGVLFLTPVVFPVPEQGLFAILVKLNPVTPSSWLLPGNWQGGLVSGLSLVGLLLVWVV
ncbi:MAG: hypothetical protein DSM107014_01300 [Gomphosphaeria aponina SAG 52.96 = DSM 107014]|uniref:Uncharacterized protein n=1 Tax=Gomphosphaeria aponina SAG 52.96 = DSM 107014 TaxID=1521640 RepID=A0A941GMR2_9CHRO|nr:hypothetical protein [Gomphosphaeria aponina SAG 52.96 = DSM 107014]